jgi:hypothetical protein
VASISNWDVQDLKLGDATQETNWRIPTLEPPLPNPSDIGTALVSHQPPERLCCAVLCCAVLYSAVLRSHM